MADDREGVEKFVEQTDTDDDVSVIAVIGKCSFPGVPKDAEYYVSKLPARIDVAAANLNLSKERLNATDADESTKEMKRINDSVNTRVIELSDRNSKMELRKQFKVETTSPDNSNNSFSRQDASGNYESLDILQKLPPGTVLIKQDAKSYREDSDYVRESSKDSTETNSSGSSSATSVITNKVKRLHRTARSKKIMEVRRNPMRVSKKNVDKDFPRPRQRLLTAKRKEDLLELDPIKRSRVSTMPYMNTRSVTRKLYTVGATYQAPSIKDETEWKEWPVHGMHERPVFHPQFGLAFEYNGRFFTSLDGCTYREILEQPEIEVVSVDPHPERGVKSLLKAGKRGKNKKAKDRHDRRNDLANKDDSFEVCMHDSLHSVFAYCAQVMSPAYEKNVEEKIEMIQKNVISKLTKNEAVASTSSDTAVTFLEEHSQKSDLIDIKKDPTSVMASLDFLNVPKVNYERLENNKYKIKETFTFVKAADTIADCGKISKETSSELNLTKLDDSAISDEALMEISSIYKKLVPIEDLTSSCENSPTDRTFCRRSSGKHAAQKIASRSTSSRKLDFSDVSEMRQENVKMAMIKEANRTDVLSYYTSNDVKNVDICSEKLSNETSEIARILSEYNQSVNGPSKRSSVKPSWLKLKKTKVENCSREEKCEEKFKSKIERILTSENVEYKSCRDKWRTLTLKKEKILENVEGLNKNPCTSLLNYRVKENSDNDRSRAPKKIDTEKSMQGNSIVNENDKSSKKGRLLQELLEDTAVLYCAATGVHQDDLAGYLDSLDSKQNIQWLEAQNDTVFKEDYSNF